MKLEKDLPFYTVTAILFLKGAEGVEITLRRTEEREDWITTI